MKRSILLFSLAALFSLEAQNQTGFSFLKESSKAFTQVAKKDIPSVVYIETEVPSKSNANQIPFFHEEFFNRFFGVPEEQRKGASEIHGGTGFFVSNEGHILTNNHLVDGANKVTVTLFGGKKLPATIVGRDPKTDLAVIQVDAKGHEFLQLADSDQLEVGEWVIAIGNPFGLDATVTVGIVSAKGRSQLNITDFEDFIQTDAAINVGNSGGPLLNLDGNVVGINTALVSASGGFAGVGFAVPSNMAKRVMEQLIQSGTVTRGFIGVSLQPLDADLAESFKLDRTRGALIASVSKNSPAEKGGLKQGDVIISYNGIPVESVAALRNAVAMMPPGTSLTLTLIREGKQFDITLKTAEAPSQDKNVTPFLEKLGLTVETATADTLKKYGYSADEQGVLVSKVEAGSLAHRTGIRAGCLILAVDQKQVEDLNAFETAMKEAAANQRVLLLVKQGSSVRFVSLKTG